MQWDNRFSKFYVGATSSFLDFSKNWKIKKCLNTLESLNSLAFGDKHVLIFSGIWKTKSVVRWKEFFRQIVCYLKAYFDIIANSLKITISSYISGSKKSWPLDVFQDICLYPVTLVIPFDVKTTFYIKLSL